MNKIHIIDKYYLRSDTYQWMISTEQGLNKKGQMEHKNLSFHHTPHQAIISLGKRLARESNADTLADLLLSTESASHPLYIALQQAEQFDSILKMEKLA